MSKDTIIFEVEGGRMRGKRMPSYAVMGQHRFKALWEHYGGYLRYDTHTVSGNPELTFLCTEAEYTYEITDASGKFVQLRLIHKYESRSE